MSKLALKPALFIAESATGVYSFTRVDGEFWCVKRYARNGRCVEVSAVDSDGEPIDWGSLEEAQAAAELHSDLVEAGAQPDFAALDVQRVMCTAVGRRVAS